MITCFGCMKDIEMFRDTVVVLGRPDTDYCLTWCKTCYKSGLYDIQKEKIETYIKQINILTTTKDVS